MVRIAACHRAPLLVRIARFQISEERLARLAQLVLLLVLARLLCAADGVVFRGLPHCCVSGLH